MERPALRRLMRDVETGLVDVVVVYKVDRLSRSLGDFAQMIDIFEKRGVSFVSVTQQFNTTSSMGRLTLNILLSFAQFEREVIGERIRDKIAASRRRGMWMGGCPPLGYDVENRKLVVNEREAALVRDIFERFVRIGSATQLVTELRAEGHRTKTWTTQGGRHREGGPIDKGTLYKLLRNRVYLGEAVHKDKSYPGEHAAIIDAKLWARVHDTACSRRHGGGTGCPGRPGASRPNLGRVVSGRARAPSPTSGQESGTAGGRPRHPFPQRGTRYRDRGTALDRPRQQG